MLGIGSIEQILILLDEMIKLGDGHGLGELAQWGKLLLNSGSI